MNLPNVKVFPHLQLFHSKNIKYTSDLTFLYSSYGVNAVNIYIYIFLNLFLLLNLSVSLLIIKTDKEYIQCSNRNTHSCLCAALTVVRLPAVSWLRVRWLALPSLKEDSLAHTPATGDLKKCACTIWPIHTIKNMY